MNAMTIACSATALGLLLLAYLALIWLTVHEDVDAWIDDYIDAFFSVGWQSPIH